MSALTPPGNDKGEPHMPTAADDLFPKVPSLARRARRAMKRAGVTARELLDGLDETKREMARECAEADAPAAKR
jgi:hypothetical protein